MEHDPTKAKIIETPCWEWSGTITEIGYARRKRNGKNIFVHRAIFEAVIRPIPDGMVLDHLCRNRGCVNPFHLEIVTNKENVLRGIGISAVNARKLKCKKGHPLYGDNLRVNTAGARVCKICYADYKSNYKKHG